VSFFNIADHDHHDNISVSCGPTNGPFDFMFAVRVPRPSQVNDSVVIQNLPFMRCNYTYVRPWCQNHSKVHRFSYISNRNAPIVLATITAVAQDVVTAPKQGHISLTENDDEMIVSFVSGSSSTPSVRFVVQIACRACC
jgi:hypothetical protein